MPSRVARGLSAASDFSRTHNTRAPVTSCTTIKTHPPQRIFDGKYILNFSPISNMEYPGESPVETLQKLSPLNSIFLNTQLGLPCPVWRYSHMAINGQNSNFWPFAIKVASVRLLGCIGMQVNGSTGQKMFCIGDLKMHGSMDI